jgi:abortive infection bacteriophage resistance protein
MASHCLCCLKKQQEREGAGAQTLGIFKPRTIKKLVITPDSADWTEDQRDKLRQNLLFEKKLDTELEKVPFKFQYEFQCDEDSCRGHKIVCTDWEMGQSWRKWRDKYGADWEGKFREKYEDEMIDRRDTHFYVGTMQGHPKVWIIVGLFYPPFPETTPLFG